MSHLSARQSALYRLNPLMLSRISVAFAAITAVWLTVASVHGEVIALIAAIAVVVTGHAGRMLAGQRSAAAVEWGLAGCGMLAEFLVYAGIAAAVSFHAGAAMGVAANSLSGTFVAGLGGVGTAGVWRLAIIAVILTVLTAMVDVCVHGPALPGTRLRLFGPPGDVRLPAGLRRRPAVRRQGGLPRRARPRRGRARSRRSSTAPVRPATEASCAATGATAGSRSGSASGSTARCRPCRPCSSGCSSPGCSTALGLRNLPGILLLTPVEAMLLAAFASWHPHDGRSDWLVPPLLQAGEYVFLAEIGYAGRVWPAMTFAVVAAVGLRHLDLAYRVRGGLANGIDRRGLGWEGRMIIAGIAAAVGIAPLAYTALALYLWYRLARDWVIGWSARHATVNR